MVCQQEVKKEKHLVVLQAPVKHFEQQLLVLDKKVFGSPAKPCCNTPSFFFPSCFVVLLYRTAVINPLLLFALFFFPIMLLFLLRPTALCALPTTIAPTPPHPVTPPLNLVLLFNLIYFHSFSFTHIFFFPPTFPFFNLLALFYILPHASLLFSSPP